MSESVTGYIDHVIFRNEENGYTVMILKGVEDEEELTCVGSGDYDGGFRGTYRKLYPASGLWKTVSGSNSYRKNAGRCHGNGTLSGIRRDQRHRCGTGGKDCETFWA